MIYLTMQLISILIGLSVIAGALSVPDQEVELLQPLDLHPSRSNSEWSYNLPTPTLGRYGNPLRSNFFRYFALRARVPTTTEKPRRVMSARSGATWYLGKRSSSKSSSYLDKEDPRKWASYLAKRFGSSKPAPWYLG